MTSFRYLGTAIKLDARVAMLPVLLAVLGGQEASFKHEFKAAYSMMCRCSLIGASVDI